jgi:hypothetical protein
MKPLTIAVTALLMGLAVPAFASDDNGRGHRERGHSQYSERQHGEYREHRGDRYKESNDDDHGRTSDRSERHDDGDDGERCHRLSAQLRESATTD